MGFEQNTTVGGSPFQLAVTAGTETDLTAAYQGAKCTRWIELLSAGVLAYVNRHGDTVVTPELPAGLRPIEAQRILEGTSADVVCYF